MPQFSIIIPVLNRAQYTKACLDSILEHTPSELADIIVVDNGSRTKTKKVLHGYGGRIKVVSLEANTGVAKAYNAGIRASQSPYLVMMHNDCIAPAGWCDNFKHYQTILDSSRIGILTPITNYSDEATFVASEALLRRFVGFKPSNKANPSIEEVLSVVDKTYEPYGGIDAFAKQARQSPIKDVDETSSFCMIFSRKMADKIGLFDESFPLRGYEDKEFLLRAEMYGFRAGRADFFLHHFGNVTSDGPGFDFHQLKESNKPIFMSLANAYAGACAKQGWSAIIFPDQEASFTGRLMRNLAKLSDQPTKIVEIPRPGIFPERKALEWALPQIDTGFVALMDSDILLDDGAITTMLSKFDGRVGCVASLMRDPCVGDDGYFRIWRTGVLKDITFASSEMRQVVQDVEYYEACERLGYKFLRIPDVVGDHAIKLDPWNVFKIFFRKGVKQLALGRVGTSAQSWGVEGAVGRTSPWSQIALLGFHCGIQAPYSEDPHHPSFDDFAYSKYLPVKSYCEALCSDCVQTDGKAAKRIKVGLVAPSFMMGGCEKTMLMMATNLDRNRFEPVIMFERGRSEEFAKVATSHGVKLVETNAHDAASWRRALVAHAPDVIISFLKNGAIEAGNSLGIPIIERTPGWPGHSGIDKGKFEQVVCEYDLFRKELLEGQFGAIPARTSLIYNPVEPRLRPMDMAEARKITGIRPDAFVVVAVARADPKKRIPDMARALKHLVASGVDAELHLLGRATHKHEQAELVEFKDIARREGITARVFFHGPREPETFMAAANVVCLASIDEGAPNVLIEAMAMGRPIAATSVGGIPEITGGLAFLVPPNDPAALAGAIKEAGKSLSVDYSRLLVRHSMQACMDKWADILEGAYLKHNDKLPYPAPPDGRTNVALLLNTLEVGGTEMFAKNMDELIDDSKFRLFVYAWRGGSMEPLFRSKVRISNAPMEMTDHKMAKWLCEDKIDVAIVVSYSRSANVFKIGRPCRIIERVDGAWYRAFSIPGMPDSVVFQSEQLARELKDEFPCRRQVTIPNGRILPRFAKTEALRSQARKALGVDLSTLLISCVGRMDACKNHRVMPLVAKILAENGIDAKVAILGPDWGQEAIIESEAREAGTLDRLILLREGSFDTARLLQASDIYVQPSTREGLSGSLIEAAAAGLPIVATDVGATSDLVDDKNGILVRDHDAPSLATAIMEMVKDKRRMSAAATSAAEASKRFCAEKMVRSYEELILSEKSMSQEDALVTVVIPVRDRAQFLREAMGSVVSQDGRWKLLIALDGMEPPKEIEDILADFKVASVVRTPLRNHCAAMNNAAKFVTTPYVIRLDSDDMLTPGAIARICSQIEADRGVDYFYCGMSFIGHKGEEMELSGRKSIMAQPFEQADLEREYVARRAICWKNSEFLAIGGFAEDIPYGEDWLFALSLMLRGCKFKPVQEILYKYRTHDCGGVSSNTTANERRHFMNQVVERYNKLKRMVNR